jgi:hypothetical protein
MPKPILPQPKGWFVYCYLRTHSNRPYYIGLGSRPDRMTAKHACKVPNDWTRIRVMREGLTKEEAQAWEIRYINHYGRRDLGTGCLVNRKDGGECGGNLSPQVLARLSEATKNNPPPQPNAEQLKKRAEKRMANQGAKYGIPIAEYQSMDKPQREAAKAWCRANPDRPFSDYVPRTMATRVVETAAARGVPLEVYEQMSFKERNALRMWLEMNPDRTGAEYLAGVRRPRGCAPRIDKDEVKRLRASGLTVTAIAEKLGCSAPHISRICSGKRRSA